MNRRTVLTLATLCLCAFAPATESIMGAVDQAKAGVGSAVNDTARELGGTLGVPAQPIHRMADDAGDDAQAVSPGTVEPAPSPS